MSPCYSWCLIVCACAIFLGGGHVEGFPSQSSNDSTVVVDPNTNATDQGVWSDWTNCSKSCGGGERNRTSLLPQCSNDVDGQDDNSTVCEEKEPCNETPCPVDGKWSDWTPSSNCSASCGNNGTQRFRRTCEPAERHGGKDCEGNREYTKKCNRRPCPIDGRWSPWDQWSDCTAPCGNTGTKHRRRTCQPTERYGGKNCVGQREETSNCNQHINCPIDGQWSPWAQPSACTASCGTTGTQQFRRTCLPAERHGGNDCQGLPEETRPCNRHHCPVDGAWTVWGSYSPCTATCGWSGTKTRRRLCLPADTERYGGEDCDGASVETESCNRRHCPVKGRWRRWSRWSLHTETCGTPTVERTRTCIPPKYGGQDCQGKKRETKVINTRVNCPVDGGWSEWRDLMECDRSLKKLQRRECTKPRRQYGGKRCPGRSTRRITCELLPVNGQWGEWTAWGFCSKECWEFIPEEQYRERRRTCDNPKPKYGGTPCVGNSTDTTDCAEKLQCIALTTKPPCTTPPPVYGGDYYGNNYDGEENGEDSPDQEYDGDTDEGGTTPGPYDYPDTVCP